MLEKNDPRVREAKLRLVAGFEAENVWLVVYTDGGQTGHTGNFPLAKAREKAEELRSSGLSAYVMLAFNFTERL